MASSWRIETRGFKELQATFKNAPRKIQDVGRAWAKDVAADEVKYIRKAAPSKTGRFRQTIQPYSRAFVIGVTIGNYPKLGARLAKWIISGTRAHPIVARRAKALRFMWKGKLRFFKSVWHPGTKPNDFIRKGAQKFQPRVRVWLNDLNKRIVNVLQGKAK